MSVHGSRQNPQTFSPFLRLQPHLGNRIYLYFLQYQATTSSFANSYVSGLRNSISIKRLRLTCRQIDEEALAVYCSNTNFIVQVCYNVNTHYPQKAYMQALEGVMFLRHIRSLGGVEIMVGHRPALLAEAGYRYDARHTTRYLGIIVAILENSKGDIRGMLLENLTLVDK